jgi:glycosyltransferase involved in cell wall biosynthesis
VKNLSDFSFVIPCYRSSASLKSLVADLVAESKIQNKGSIEIVLVLDSRDYETFEKAEALAHSFESVRIIRLSRNFGQQAATVCGVINSLGRIIVTMDDDYQQTPSDAFRLVEILLATSEVDLAYGRPNSASNALGRRIAGDGFRKILKMSGLPFAELTSPFRAFRGEFRETFKLATGHQIFVDLILGWVASEVKSIDCKFLARKDSSSSYNLRNLTRLALTMLMSNSTLPLRVGVYVGGVGLLFSIAYSSLALMNYYLVGVEIPGYTSILISVLFMGSVQIVIIGILGVYIGSQFERGMGRPAYQVMNNRLRD